MNDLIDSINLMEDIKIPTFYYTIDTTLYGEQTHIGNSCVCCYPHHIQQVIRNDERESRRDENKS